MFRTLCRAVTGIVLGGLPALVLAVQDCEINGVSVNPNNGYTTQGKTGIMKCRDRDSGRLVRETEYVDGREQGYRKSVDYQGQTVVGNFNAQGNRDGDFKTYAPDGTLRSEERYVNGSVVGVAKQFNAAGKLVRISFSEAGKGALASRSYNDAGQLTELRCAPQQVLPDDAALCGFGKASAVELFNSRGQVVASVRHDSGQRVAYTTFSAPGVPASSEEVQGPRIIRKQFHPDGSLRLETLLTDRRRDSESEFAKGGQKIRETTWGEFGKSGETLWFLNGAMRSRETRQTLDGVAARVQEDYYDSGKLRARSAWTERGKPIGMFQQFYESGVLATETFHENGVMVRRKFYEETGRLKLEEEYFEDGSRKGR